MINPLRSGPAPTGRTGLCLALGIVLGAGGCGRESTSQLIEKLQAADGLTRLKAVRTLPQGRPAAATGFPAHTGPPQPADADVRRGAALGLGTFGDQAHSGLPALKSHLHDPDAGVVKAVRIALSYIDPKQFPAPTRPPQAGVH